MKFLKSKRHIYLHYCVENIKIVKVNKHSFKISKWPLKYEEIDNESNMGLTDKNRSKKVEESCLCLNFCTDRHNSGMDNHNLGIFLKNFFVFQES